MTSSCVKYFRTKKYTYVILIILGVLVYFLVLLIGDKSDFWYTLIFWEAFVLLFALWQCQLNLCEKKKAVICDITEQVARELDLQCENPKLWDYKQCMESLFFPSYIDAFYYDRDIPHQVFTQNKQGTTLQYSHVSCGEMFAKVNKVGDEYVLSGRRTLKTFKITSVGLLFRCSLPFYFSETWLLLPRKWGKHLEKISYENFLMKTFHKKAELPLNLRLIKNRNNILWIYSSIASDQGLEENKECISVEKYYSILHDKSYSLMSFTGNTMYVYIPFNWEMTSEQKLQDCITEYKANIELVMGIISNELMHRYYEQQFVAINDC